MLARFKTISPNPLFVKLFLPLTKLGKDFAVSVSHWDSQKRIVLLLQRHYRIPTLPEVLSTDLFNRFHHLMLYYIKRSIENYSNSRIIRHCLKGSINYYHLECVAVQRMSEKERGKKTESVGERVRG